MKKIGVGIFFNFTVLTAHFCGNKFSSSYKCNLWLNELAKSLSRDHLTHIGQKIGRKLVISRWKIGDFSIWGNLTVHYPKPFGSQKRSNLRIPPLYAFWQKYGQLWSFGLSVIHGTTFDHFRSLWRHFKKIPKNINFAIFDVWLIFS